MIKPRPKPDDILARLVAQAIDHGADGLEIEYKDGHEEVCAMKGCFGFGIARMPSSSEEATALRDQLCAIGRKGKTITTAAGDFRLKVSPFESFGETAYLVEIQKRPSK